MAALILLVLANGMWQLKSKRIGIILMSKLSRILNEATIISPVTLVNKVWSCAYKTQAGVKLTEAIS